MTNTIPDSPEKVSEEPTLRLYVGRFDSRELVAQMQYIEIASNDGKILVGSIQTILGSSHTGGLYGRFTHKFDYDLRVDAMTWEDWDAKLQPLEFVEIKAAKDFRTLGAVSFHNIHLVKQLWLNDDCPTGENLYNEACHVDLQNALQWLGTITSGSSSKEIEATVAHLRSFVAQQTSTPPDQE